MADVTISQLNSQAPTSDDIFPFSTSGVTPSTYKASLAQIKTSLGLATVATTGSYNDLIDRPTIQLVKAWVNFNAYPATSSGTYSRSGNLITVTLTNHSMQTGMKANLNFTSGGGTSGTYSITRTGTNTFTVNDTASGSTSGNVSLRLYIRSSYNVSSVTTSDNTFWRVNFSSPMADAYYAVLTGNSQQVSGNGQPAHLEVANNTTSGPVDKTVTGVLLCAGNGNSAGFTTSAEFNCIIIGN